MRIYISHKSVIPLHEQLHNQLRQLILSGRWPPEHRIPSETELQRQLKISRSTIRQALGNAEIEGLIERVPGKGTFVAHPHSRNSTNRLIAFVVFDFDRPIQRRLLSGAESAAQVAGYRIIFSNSNSNIDEEKRILAQLQRDGVAGVLLWPSADSSKPEHLAEKSQGNFPPVTMMDRTFEGVAWDFVGSDNYGGTLTAMQHLIELGHQRVVFLSCPILELLPIAERYQAYRDALHRADFQPYSPWLVGRANQEISSTNALQAYCAADDPIVREIVNYVSTSNEPPTAVFAANDNMALLSLKAASVLGMRVPEDLSVVGFDDMAMASYLATPLTSVAQDSFAIGKRAAEMLIERIEGWYVGEPRSERMATQLRPRASTAAPRLSKSPAKVNFNERPPQ